MAPPALAREVRPVPRVPGYRLLRRIGSGGSGVVYQAIQEAVGREVAVKVVRPGLFELPETRCRFVEEPGCRAG